MKELVELAKENPWLVCGLAIVAGHTVVGLANALAKIITGG